MLWPCTPTWDSEQLWPWAGLLCGFPPPHRTMHECSQQCSASATSRVLTSSLSPSWLETTDSQANPALTSMMDMWFLQAPPSVPVNVIQGFRGLIYLHFKGACLVQMESIHVIPGISPSGFRNKQL